MPNEIRPIDAVALAKEMDMIYFADKGNCLDVYANINDAPTLDYAPVVHGQWIPIKVDAIVTEFECSECHRTVKCANDYFGKATKFVSSKYPHCHCGAKMDKEAD